MLLIYAKQKSSRLNYISSLIFNELFGVEFEIVNDSKSFADFAGVKINYSEENFNNSVSVKPHKLLFEENVIEQNPKVFEWRKHKAFFKTNENNIVPFDLFAASFYLISRYEEYLYSKKDKHNRYLPYNSIAYKNDFLNKPLVNIWLEELKFILKNKYPELSFKKRQFSFIPSYDIDLAFAHHGRGFFRTILGFAKAALHFRLNDIVDRIKTFLGVISDPYDNFNFHIDVHKRFNLKAIYFYLIADFGEFDKNTSYKNKRFRSLLKKTNTHSDVGLHASYSSNSDYDVLKEECHRLSEVLGRSIFQNRQHFLKLDLPKTFRNLIKLGITEDYTMGYAHENGFRASICNPFYFFDLDENKETELKIFPFVCMDECFIRFKKLTPDEAFEQIKILIDEVKAFNGTFIPVLHNHSLSNYRQWKGWREVYENMCEYASGITNSP